MSGSASRTPSYFRPGIFEWTGLQFLRYAPRSLSELDSADHPSLEVAWPLTLPGSEDLPPDAASFPEIGSFIARFDPTRHFRERWGEGYRVAVEKLWHDCVSAFRNSRGLAVAPGELLLCLAYDWRLGPCLGVAEHEKLAFLRWLIAQVRTRLHVA
jgi:hypothetical protein